MPEIAVDVVWGPTGSRQAAARGRRVVVVDVLSFSTAVTTAVERGLTVVPVGPGSDPREVARRHGAEVSVARADWPAKGRFCLSPASFRDAVPPARVALRSPNGAGCVEAAAGAPEVLVASLRNATAVAAWIADTAASRGRAVTVVACAELQPDGSTRFALEDWLGAGAVALALGGARTPDAEAAARTFGACREDLGALLAACPSGRELEERGFAGDVAWAAAHDAADAVPVLSANGRIADVSQEWRDDEEVR